MGHFVQQPLIHRDPPPFLHLQPAELIENPLPALRHIGDHPLGAEDLRIFRRGREFHFLPQKPVSARPVAGGDARPGEGDRLCAEQADQPPHRADEPRPSASPAHRSRQMDGGKHLGEPLRQAFRGGLPLLYPPGEQVLLPFVFVEIQVIQGDPLFPGESLRCRPPLSILLEGDPLGGSSHHLLHIPLALGHPFDPQREPPGCGICMAALVVNPLFPEPLFDPLL